MVNDSTFVPAPPVGTSFAIVRLGRISGEPADRSGCAERSSAVFSRVGIRLPQSVVFSEIPLQYRGVTTKIEGLQWIGVDLYLSEQVSRNSDAAGASWWRSGGSGGTLTSGQEASLERCRWMGLRRSSRSNRNSGINSQHHRVHRIRSQRDPSDQRLEWGLRWPDAGRRGKRDRV